MPVWRLNRHFSSREGKERVTWRLFSRGKIIARSARAYPTLTQCEHDLRRVRDALQQALKD